MQDCNLNFSEVNEDIIKCVKCTRLVEYIKNIESKKVKRYRNLNYWSKPVSGFGDIDAELMIIGLAPAAHGGNRTGRMFTGDSSGDWLIKALYEFNLCNQSFSNDINDGLILRNVYITSIVKCSPPKNKPLPEEINTRRLPQQEEGEGLSVLSGGHECGVFRDVWGLSPSEVALLFVRTCGNACEVWEDL